MKKLVFALLGALSFAGVCAQSMHGEITGKIFDELDNDVIIGAKVWVEQGDVQFATRTANNGRFRISAVPSGTYTLYITYLSDTMEVHNQTVRPDGICIVPDIYFSAVKTTTTIFIGRSANEQTIDQGNEHMDFISATTIGESVHRTSLVDLLKTVTTNIQTTTSGDIIIRGSRPADVQYFLDGVKMDNLANIPGISLNGITVYAGGVPAKYGDTTGGVIIMETKSYFDLYRSWKIAMTMMN